MKKMQAKVFSGKDLTPIDLMKQSSEEIEKMIKTSEDGIKWLRENQLPAGYGVDTEEVIKETEKNILKYKARLEELKKS
jgi:hypothetical protein